MTDNHGEVPNLEASFVERQRVALSATVRAVDQWPQLADVVVSAPSRAKATATVAELLEVDVDTAATILDLPLHHFRRSAVPRLLAELRQLESLTAE
jgi:hypothetical protein